MQAIASSLLPKRFAAKVNDRSWWISDTGIFMLRSSEKGR
jgi:hypothetical protein